MTFDWDCGHPADLLVYRLASRGVSSMMLGGHRELNSACRPPACFTRLERTTMASRAVNAMIAIGLSLLPVPAMRLLDHLNSGCGDGMCGFWSGLLIIGGLAAATLVFVGRSARRNETPALLRLVPFALWALALVPMFL
jgi:hypothetical protein